MKDALPDGFIEVINHRTQADSPLLTVSASYLRLNDTLATSLGTPQRLRIAANGAGWVALIPTTHTHQGWKLTDQTIRIDTRRFGLVKGRYLARIDDGIAYIQGEPS